MPRIQLSPLYAIRITICTNAETLLDGRDVEAAAATEAEIVSEAASAANQIFFDRLGGYAETDSFFPNWHGGKFRRATLSVGSCAASVLSRDSVDGEWNHARWNDLSLDNQLSITEALDEANTSMDTVFDAWEKSAADATSKDEWFAQYSISGAEPTDWATIQKSYGTREHAEAAANAHPQPYCRVLKSGDKLQPKRAKK